MAISFVTSSFAGATSQANPITIGSNPAVGVGNLMIVGGVIEDATNTLSMSAPWTKIVDAPLSTRTHHQYVWWKVAGVAEATSYNVYASATDESCVGMVVFSGADKTAPIVSSSVNVNNVSDTWNTAPPLNIQYIGDVYLHIGSAMYGTTSTPPTGSPTFAEILDRNTAAAASNQILAMSWATYTATGTTGIKTAVLADSDYNIASAVEIKMKRRIIFIND